jgi:hypothetical protein
MYLLICLIEHHCFQITEKLISCRISDSVMFEGITPHNVYWQIAALHCPCEVSHLFNVEERRHGNSLHPFDDIFLRRARNLWPLLLEPGPYSCTNEVRTPYSTEIFYFHFLLFLLMSSSERVVRFRPKIHVNKVKSAKKSEM